MFVDVKKRVPYATLMSVSDDMKEAFSQIKDEFEDHLIAINENTNEIQSIYQYFGDIDSKIEKLGQRIDQIQLFLQQNGSMEQQERPAYAVRPLTKKEQEIFLLLYTMEEKGAADYVSLARITNLTEDLVSSYITSISEKGIPIVKRYINGKAYLSLDNQFKQLQTKENIVGIEQRTFRNI